MQNQCRARMREKGAVEGKKTTKVLSPPFFTFLSFLFPRLFLTMLFLLSCKS
ncbi:hypothetical protein GHT06_012428 [Daphnia sinensis]|uniref:Uncharacterized protein n=1 Tax=Daphnia sinensis TaxID=1820382 RepID=A0AAD5LGA2_9CRUS|nr:hypothetical protein GHT06_012428 [Daphnia sinensis]